MFKLIFGLTVLFSFSLKAHEKFHYYTFYKNTKKISLCFEFNSSQKPEFSKAQKERNIFGTFLKKDGPCPTTRATVCKETFEGSPNGFKYYEGNEANNTNAIYFLFERIKTSTFVFIDNLEDFSLEEKKGMKLYLKSKYCSEGTYVDYNPDY
jgi:hypothetical protein